MPAALFGQIQAAQRVADRLPDLCAAGMGANKAANREVGLAFQDPPGGGSGLIHAIEARQGCGMQDVVQAETLVCLRRLGGGLGCRFEIAPRAVRHRECAIGERAFSPKWDQAQRPLGVINRPVAVTGMRQDDGAHPERGYGRAGQGQRAVDHVHCGLVVMRDKADDKAGDGERCRIIGAGLDSGMRMSQRGVLVGVVQSASEITHLIAPGGSGLRRRIIRLQGQRLVEQAERFVGLTGHRHKGMRQGAQIEIIGVEAVRTLALGTFDLGLAEARLDRPDQT